MKKRKFTMLLKLSVAASIICMLVFSSYARQAHGGSDPRLTGGRRAHTLPLPRSALRLQRSGLHHYRGAAFGQQRAGVFDPERVLPAAAAVE